MKMKEFLGPVLATFVLILLGDGVVANVVLAPRGGVEWYSWNTIAFGWAFAVAASGLITGGNNNPAITLANAVRGTLPWSKVVPTILGTFLGGFLGAAAVFLVYRDGLVAAGLPNVWTSGPGLAYDAAHTLVGPYSLVTASVAEFFGTIILMWSVLAVGDKKNAALSKAGAFVVAGVVLVIGLSLGGPSGYAINPARDLAPRIFGALTGTKGLFEGWYWLIPPVLVPCVACILATVVYDAVLGSEKAAELGKAQMAA
jgi:glycerol uptake facilitator protein